MAISCNEDWDVTSIAQPLYGKLPPSRHIEITGRVKDSAAIKVTCDENHHALNQADKFVLVDGNAYE